MVLYEPGGVALPNSTDRKAPVMRLSTAKALDAVDVRTVRIRETPQIVNQEVT
jgi:hypothetical protein